MQYGNRITLSVIAALLVFLPALTPAAVETGNEQPRSPFTDADYADRLRELKMDPPIEGLTWFVEKPFIVAGNQRPAMVRRYVAGTVRWATKMFRKHYFPKDPDTIITIWLLGDARSYTQVAETITGRKPGTPYGFYSSPNDALVMNIATGGGTLVHEMFHAFIPANFPECPSWLNEGIASLYEQCGRKNGMIRGLTNWRLRGLQKAIGGGNTISFKKLTGTTSSEFYGPGSGVHYAQARYLCYYLQEKGLLLKYYRAYRAAVKADPTGYKTLVATLGGPDMDAFQRGWEAWCMKLRFPPSR